MIVGWGAEGFNENELIESEVEVTEKCVTEICTRTIGILLNNYMACNEILFQKKYIFYNFFAIS